MKKIGLYVMAMASVALGACSTANKPADGGEDIVVDTADLQSGWYLESYRIGGESTKFDGKADYKLSFNGTDSTFSISTDCNMINGEFGIANDTIRFRNMLVTQMACENMTVEQNMLSLLNDSTAYAVCHGDTLAFTAPHTGSAIFLKQSEEHPGN